MRLAPVGLGAATFLALWWMLSGHFALFDTDSYFHLAAARRYLDVGLRDGLPWARFSVMYEGFGDKELLFHLLLAPLASWFGPTGGRFAVAVLNGVIAAVRASTR